MSDPGPTAPKPATTGSPFIGPSQTKRVRAICQIIVAGKDVTSNLNPHLINVHIVDKSPSADATIELDDRDGKLPLPPNGSPVSIALGWRYENVYTVFTGWVCGLEHGFGRTQGGRRMWIQCKGHNTLNALKTPKMNTAGEGAEPGQKEGKKVPAQEIFSKAMEGAGMAGKIHSKLNVQRDHWMQNNESGQQFGQRLADQIGGIFNMVGDKAEITVPGENADGSSRGTIYAKWGDNLIAWRVHIFEARDNNSGGQQQSYDHQTGAWDFAKKAFGFAMNPPSGGGEAGNTGPAATEGNAGQDNEARGGDSETNMGDGRIVINGEPRAKANMYVELTGARPGVDGVWWCFSAEHIYSREGYITWLDVKPWHVDGGSASGANVGDGMEWYDKTGIVSQAEKLKKGESLL